MRFKEYTLPRNGDTRVVKFFAFLPVSVRKIISGRDIVYTRWLENVTVKQRYKQDAEFHSNWENIEFIDT